MKKFLASCFIISALVATSACTTEDDFPELIVGKWLPEYGVIEKYDDQGHCIGTERIEPQGDKYVTEFMADGKVNSYKNAEEPTNDNQNRTYRIEGKHLYFVAANGYEIRWDIIVLNRKTLDISTEIEVGSNYDSPEPGEVYPGVSHTVFKRI